jgi:hypothetical protein
MRILLAIAIVALSACGGDDSPTELEGIYQLSTWTANPDGCDQEGPPALEASSYSHFFVRHDQFFGEEFLVAVMCEDLEECRTDAADTDTLYIGQFLFEDGNDADGWLGFRSFLFSETCDGTVDEQILTGDAGSAVRIEQETKSVTAVPLDDEGECDSEAARAQAADLECEQLAVVTGTYLEAI